MNTINFNDCRKAVNQATFRPTAERKSAAAKLLQEALDFINNLEEVKESKPKAKKRRAKATKRTPAQRTADHMDKQAMRTNEVGPVKPKSKARKADVQAAKASAEAVSKHTGATAKATKRAEAKAKAVTKESVTPTQPKVDDARFAALEAKISALTECLAVAMESMTPPAQEFLGYDDVPFTL